MTPEEYYGKELPTVLLGTQGRNIFEVRNNRRVAKILLGKSYG